MGSSETLGATPPGLTTLGQIHLLVEGTASATGEAFLGKLAPAVANAMGTRFAFLADLRGPDELEMRSLWNGRTVSVGKRYPLRDSPWERAILEPVCMFEERVRERYPGHPLLEALEVDSLIATALVGGNGEALGVLSAFHPGPLPPEARESALLRFCAARAAAEIERVRFDAQLQKSEAFAHGIIESSQDGILSVTETGQIRTINSAAQQIFGLDRLAAAGRSIGKLLPTLQAPATLAALGRSAERQDGPATRILEGKRLDGTTFPAEVAVSLLAIGPENLRTVTVRDVTVRRREEEQLREHAKGLARANRELDAARQTAEKSTQIKGEFLANMSHELRTPMTAILGFTEILFAERGAEGLAPEQRDALRAIRRNGEHLLEIVNDLLDFSRLEADRLELERIPCSPLRLLAEIDTLMGEKARAKGIEFGVRLGGAVPETIESDPVRLRQILLNLVGNAVKFTQAGNVQVTARFADPSRLELEVEDTGVGMSKEQLARAFDSFAQADSSITRRFGGTGLGLAITKRLTDLFGGTINARSRAGAGSVFRVRLPVGVPAGTAMVRDFGDPDVATEARLAEQIQAAKLEARILLVEDGVDNQRVIRHILEKAGCTVEIAENGQVGVHAALAAVRDQLPFDVILMDLQMPVLDGIQATQQLRENGYAAPIIALTAHALPGKREECLAAGCDDFCTKPIDRFALLELLRAYIDKSQRSGTVETGDPL